MKVNIKINILNPEFKNSFKESKIKTSADCEQTCWSDISQIRRRTGLGCTFMQYHFLPQDGVTSLRKPHSTRQLKVKETL